ncbi:3,4-dihydroxy-2-butanone 4-phosphate synthase [Nocardia nova]|uniref:3,4-dihydroxy-2-butanone-4-phosphate synthase n=1 Tax=Nocardia nova TaxID=37330 RepID=UPI000CE9B2A6|nr:3,4-dihydroxy-2-butanone-4-phosphate synthase [Nocardia nova]PPJ14417.1 3,4-dihydroxy-2-butanone 4-phosphate synthase [Nocardia nova]
MTVPTAPTTSRAADRLDEAVAALRTGHVALAVDDIMGTGCDIVVPADSVTVAAIASMVRYGSGFICATVDSETCRRLELPPASWHDDCNRWYAGSMRVAVDSASGITTGISARDRASTLRVLADATATPAALRRPGHVVPVLAENESGPSSRPAILATAASLSGDGRSMAFCAVVRDHAVFMPAGPADAGLPPLPTFRYSDVARLAM